MAKRNLVVLAISEYEDRDRKIQTRFTRIGRAFDNDSGSITLDLTALPIPHGSPPQVRLIIKQDDDRRTEGDQRGQRGSDRDRSRA